MTIAKDGRPVHDLDEWGRRAKPRHVRSAPCDQLLQVPCLMLGWRLEGPQAIAIENVAGRRERNAPILGAQPHGKLVNRGIDEVREPMFRSSLGLRCGAALKATHGTAWNERIFTKASAIRPQGTAAPNADG
jgi:hypothetical protein